jgi:pimeloyl-ACP methyl ester carboxylesterase
MISRAPVHSTFVGTSGQPWTTVGWLTVPDRLLRSELQILLHGGTYDHRYWDWPIEPQTYSYVDWAAANGIATIAIDRIGCGASSKPPGREVSVLAQVEPLRKLLGEARRGDMGFGSGPFDRVVLIAHSLGSFLAAAEASRYADVDAVVLTGTSALDQRLGRDGKVSASRFRAALDDPAMGAHDRPDRDYLTTLPKTRDAAMFYRPATDPAVIEIDEHLKGTVTTAELDDAPDAAEETARIGVPTLVAFGQYDVVAVDPTRGDRDGYDTVRRCSRQAPGHFDFEVVEQTGHCLNLHRSAPQTFELITKWLDLVAQMPPQDAG